MSDVIIPYRYKTRGGTAANLATVNEVPLARELVVEIDTGRMKLGDGTSAYNELPYIGLGEIDFTDVSDGRVLAWDSANSRFNLVDQSGGSGGGDPFIGNLASLLHFDGTDGSTTFTDVRGKTWAGSGSAQIDTDQSKFGGASLLMDGSGDYVSASHSDLDLTQESSWTIEGFIRTPTFAATQSIFFNGSLGSNASRIQLYINTSGNLIGLIQGSSGGASNALSSSTLSVDTWYHVAFVRSGSIVRIFINGVLEGSFTFSGAIGASNFFAIGNGLSGGSEATFNGHIDECRITKGQSRYTVNFDPPTAAFPNA